MWAKELGKKSVATECEKKYAKFKGVWNEREEYLDDKGGNRTERQEVGNHILK